jgi:hypothetical protein
MLVDFRNKLNEMELELSKYFSQLITNHTEIVIIDDFDAVLDDAPDDYFEWRNEITGGVSDVHVIKVDEYGIYVMNAQNYSARYTIRFSDLGSIQDRINLCELMFNKANGL